jgi:L-threonylcarbamoyladenylate synthase
MPTETVYGLAANALDSDAIAKIYQAKGRPAENPLITHVADFETAQTLAEWNSVAEALATAFWPGPLTVVLPSRGLVAPAVQGGKSTVALRMPTHPVALRLITQAHVPVAAPSANRFMSLSPTDARNVEPLIGEASFGILDGGPCEVGIESTIVRPNNGMIEVLRLGMISVADLLPFGKVERTSSTEISAPGQYVRHYAPRVPVRLVKYADPEVASLTRLCATSVQIPMPRDPRGYAARLYAAIHELEEGNPEEIQIETPPESPEWDAIWDRLRRMSFRDLE